jgi:hypothetical protein
MTPEPASTNVFARYTLRFGGGPVILITGAAFLALVAFSLVGKSGEERLVSLALLAVSLAGIGSVGVVMALVGLRAVEVTTAGTIDFVSRIKRQSFPRTALMKVDGKTTTGSRGGSTHWVTFIFTEAGQKEVRKAIHVPRSDDPALQAFVQRLEGLNPRLDASPFWAWSRGAEVSR